MSRKCFLKSVKDIGGRPIELAHLVKTAVGRSKETGIADPNCSRRQIELEANCDNCTVKLTPLGLNVSGYNGFALKKDVEYEVGHGSHIEILLNEFIYEVIFDPPPDTPKITPKTEKIAPKTEKRKVDAIEKETTPNPEKKIKIKNEITEGPAAMEKSWESIDNGLLHIFTSQGCTSRSLIAAYDMDGTLIKTKSGKVFPVNTDDWQLAFSEVPTKLRKLHDSGYKVVIFTNQSGIGNGKISVKDFRNKIEGIVARIGIPMQAYIATGKGVYRKPSTGMWDTLTQMKNDDIEVNIEESLYCGDAAGRLANWAPGKKKDHSQADRFFAENLQLKFYTPECHFQNLHEVSKRSEPEFDPKNFAKIIQDKPLERREKEIVVMVGFPGSGKSVIAHRMEKNPDFKYKTVCRDTLGSWQKCSSNAASYLDAGKSVIVDSTNPDVESRARWIELAKKKSVPCRCFKVSTSMIHSRHNNRFRELTDTSHATVTDMVFHSYKNKYKEPSTSEGFQEVVDVGFTPDFQNDDHEKLYYMHLLEK